jgi:Recombination endonuclease VII
MTKKEYDKARYALLSKEYKKRAIAVYRRNPALAKQLRWERRIIKEYKITPKEWYKMYDDQGGCCALCGKHQDHYTRKLATDHNHKTGQVRALLCGYCNQWRVGRLNKKWAQLVHEYLQKYDKEEVS